MKYPYLAFTIYSLLIIIKLPAYAQAPAPPAVVAGIPVNYDEQRVGAYSLPDPLTAKDGSKVKDADTWLHKRRPEIVKLFEEQQFGKAPAKPAALRFDVFDKGTPVFNGTAIRKQVTIYLANDTLHKMDLLMYLPAKAVQPPPLLLQVSFFPNSLAVNDPGVKPGFMWDKTGHRVPAVRTRPSTLPVERFIANGIGVATIYYGDIEPDFKDGIRQGIRGLYLKPDASWTANDEWGAISAWAWGLSRAMDYLQQDKSVDARRIAITGASRLGKTALWTGAHDTRFALVIASISGEGGAALSRRNYGETVAHITDTSRYFYQFAPNYHSYSNRVNSLPMDGHMLISLVAPRPLLLQTGNADYWSDPKGEFLAAVAAEPVYRLFGKQGLGTDVMPLAGDTTLLHPLGYYMHNGGHAVLPEDYEVFIKFIHKYLGQ